jgi:hypothetical protein
MRYMLMIFSDQEAEQKGTPEQLGQLFGGYMKFTEEIKQSGHYVSGAPLQPTSTATTVRIAGSKPVIKDGPFIETKEALGGYYIVEAKDLDEANAIATRICRLHTWNSVTLEVRPVMEMSEHAGAGQ